MAEDKPLENSPEVKAVIGFATKAALAGPTPKALKLFYQLLAVASAAWAILIEPIFTNIPVEHAHHIDQFLLALNAFIYHICRLFGWVLPVNKETTEV